MTIGIACRSCEPYIRIGSRWGDRIYVDGNASSVVQRRRRNIALICLLGDLRIRENVEVHVAVCVGDVVTPVKDCVPINAIADFDDDPIQENTGAARC